MDLRRLGWTDNDVSYRVKKGRLQRQDEMDIFYPNFEDRIYYPKDKCSDTGHTYGEYTNASHPYNNQYVYQNRDYWTEYSYYYGNTDYGRRGYPLNRQTRYRASKSRINNGYQQYSRSNYSCSKVDTTETVYKNQIYSGLPTVSNGNNNTEKCTEGSISLDELSDAETVQLEDGHDVMGKDERFKSDVKEFNVQQQDILGYDNRSNCSNWKISHYTKQFDSVSKLGQSRVSENMNKQISDTSASMSKTQSISKDKTNDNGDRNIEKPFRQHMSKNDKRRPLEQHQTKAVDKINAADFTETYANVAINTKRNDKQKKTSILGDMLLFEGDNNSIATYASEKVKEIVVYKENFRKMPGESNITHSGDKYSISNNKDNNHNICKENHKNGNVIMHKTDLKEKEKFDKPHCSNKDICERKESIQNPEIKRDETVTKTVKKSSNHEGNCEKSKYGAELKCARSTELSKNQVQVPVETKIDNKVTTNIKKKEGNGEKCKYDKEPKHPQSILASVKIKTNDKLDKSNNKCSQGDIVEKYNHGAEPKYTQSTQLSNQRQVSVTEISDTTKSDALFTSEDICRLNTELANLEPGNKSLSEDALSDMEVQQIMSNTDVQLINDVEGKANTRLRVRGRSCSLHDRRQSIQGRREADIPNLSRSKSLQARDFLCYTPFRITRSMSNNWLLTSGIDDGNIQRTFDGKSGSRRVAAAAIRKRRRTIDPSEIPSKKPSLFSEQTPYVKPPEIEFDYTPRHSDSPIGDVDASEIPSDVTVIYNEADSTDPRRKSNTFKININGRELIKYTDYVKENATLLQKNQTKPKVAIPKKIGSRRKSSTSSKDHDPNSVPSTKVAITPRRSLAEDGIDYVPPKKVSIQSTQSFFPRSPQISTTGEILAKKCDKLRRLSSSNKYSKCESSEAKDNSIHIIAANNGSVVDNIVKNVACKENTKRELPPKRRNSINARIRHYNDVVQSLSFTAEFCTPLRSNEPKKCNASLKIEEDRLVKAKITIVQSLLHKPEENSKQKSAPLPVRRNFVNTPATIDLNIIFDDLANLFSVIQTMKGLQHSCMGLFYALSVPIALKNSELTIANEFYDNRIRYWTNLFQNLCERLKSETCSARRFVFNLMVCVKNRNPQMSYGWFLNILNLIINTNSPSTPSMSYVKTLKLFVSALTGKRTQEVNTIVNASVGVQSERSSNPVDQQIRQNGGRVPTTSIQSIFSTEQLRTLQHQMKSYTKLVYNHKYIVPRSSSHKFPLANTGVIKKPTKQDTLSKQPLQQRQRSFNSSEHFRPKYSALSFIPSLLTIPSIKVKVPPCPVPNTRTSNYNTSRRATVISTSDNSSYPITIPANDTVFPSTIASTTRSQNTELQSSIENNATRPEIVNMDLGLQTNNHDTVAPQVVEDLQSTHMHDEFVDAEHYLSFNNIFNSSTEQNRSVSDVLRIHSIGDQRSADNVDLPPRTASNDSGMDSPSQVDCLVYENRICLCGKPAVYLCPCKAVIYCSEACQLVDWEQHRQSYDHQRNSAISKEI
ncbi:hypothetical protein AMK59_2237 [Oryctes borbonicus]|uniref:MYND-type domain-containing protein n=1 Tax=Oryctes borbonicus TaxID=1629725 RepID=A0A0T6BG64_9SCAR|nr:hypothetical protein AMK59_2237 [Oryctes borbonicus]